MRFSTSSKAKILARHESSIRRPIQALPARRHMITDGSELVDDMSWTHYQLLKGGNQKMIFSVPRGVGKGKKSVTKFHALS
jgi:hypothetical protein